MNFFRPSTLYILAFVQFYFLCLSTTLAQKYPDDETAIKNIVARLKKEPKNPSLLFQMAWFMQKRNFEDLAEKYYNKCLDINPRYSPALVNLGNLYARQKKKSLAEKYFLKAIEYTPNSDEAHYNLGAFHLKNKNFRKAALDFEKVLQLRPQNKEALLNLARIHLHFYVQKPEIEQLAIAKDYLIRAAKIAPRYAHIHFNLGKISELEGKKGIALEYYKKASTLYRTGSKYHTLSVQKIAELQ